MSKSELVSVKETDYLDQDPPIRGQKFVCMSFVSPEDVIQTKEVFFFNRFVNAFSSDMTEFFTNLGERFADNQDVQEMITNVKTRYDYIFNAESLQHEYDHFKEQNNEKLESEYFEKNNFQTTIRGIKVRGCYESIKEAQMRAEQIKKFDKNFHVYVGEVGCWCPWSPYPNDIQDQEYTETQLNTLMKKYKEGQEIKDELFRLRKDDMVNKVKMWNTKKKEDGTTSEIQHESADALPVQVVQEEGDATTDAVQQQNAALMTEPDPWQQRQMENN